MESFREVGVVKTLYRYPVKSMQGHAVPAAEIYWHGLRGDRRAAFVRGDNHSNFPWLTGRQLPQLLLYRPRFRQPDEVITSPIEVETPNGRVLPLQSPELHTELAQAYGHDIHLIELNRGTFDSQVLSLMSMGTADALSQGIGLPVDGLRFRQNIIIETFNNHPYEEETWLNGLLTFGQRPDSAQIRLNRRIPRCVMVNIDPKTADKEPGVLQFVAQQRDNCVGIHAFPQKIGTIQVGDVICLSQV